MDPTNYQEYLARTHQNTVIRGHGLGNVYTDFPCPFCAAPEFMTAELMETEKVIQRNHTCKECGRSAKFIVTKTDDGSTTTAQLVQTGGPEQPDYFTHKMPRIDETASPPVA